MKIAIIADSSLHILGLISVSRAGLRPEILPDGRIYVRVEGLSEDDMKTLLLGLDYVVSTLDE